MNAESAEEHVALNNWINGFFGMIEHIKEGTKAGQLLAPLLNLDPNNYKGYIITIVQPIVMETPEKTEANRKALEQWCRGILYAELSALHITVNFSIKPRSMARLHFAFAWKHVIKQAVKHEVAGYSSNYRAWLKELKRQFKSPLDFQQMGINRGDEQIIDDYRSKYVFFAKR